MDPVFVLIAVVVGLVGGLVVGQVQRVHQLDARTRLDELHRAASSAMEEGVA